MVVVLDGNVISEADAQARDYRANTSGGFPSRGGRVLGSPSAADKHGKPIRTNAARLQQLKTITAYSVPLIISVAVTAFLLQYFGLSSNIKSLSVANPAQLREVFFSGQPWVVVCVKDDGKDCLSGGFLFHAGKVPEIVEKASEELRKMSIHTGAMDCNEVLPDSGKTVFERFDLGKGKSQSKALVFLTGNAQRPAKVDSKHMEVCGK
jgi:hypothetical protein